MAPMKIDKDAAYDALLVNMTRIINNWSKDAEWVRKEGRPLVADALESCADEAGACLKRSMAGVNGEEVPR